MSQKGEFTGIGLLIYNAVVQLGTKGISREQVAELLNISVSTLGHYYKFPPKDIEVLLELSRKLDTNLLIFYQNQEPLKSWFNRREEEIKRLMDENLALKKDKEYLVQMIDLQKEKLEAKNQ